MLARLRRSLRPSGTHTDEGAAAAGVGASNQAGSVLERLISLAAPAEPALLPVRTKPGSATPSPGRRQRAAPVGARRLRRAAALAAVLLLVTAAGAGCAAGGYMLSVIYEPAGPLALAAAEVQAAASLAAPPAGPTAPDPLQPDTAVAAAATPDSLDMQPQLPANYTVVVMSYAGRRATLPLVVRKLGSCPSGAPGRVRRGGWEPAAAPPGRWSPRLPRHPLLHDPCAKQPPRCWWCGMGRTPQTPTALARAPPCVCGRRRR